MYGENDIGLGPAEKADANMAEPPRAGPKNLTEHATLNSVDIKQLQEMVGTLQKRVCILEGHVGN